MATLTGVGIAQVNVAQEQLPAFLKTAEKLKIKGLAEGTQGSDNWEDFARQVYIEIKSVSRDLYHAGSQDSSKDFGSFFTELWPCHISYKMSGFNV